MKQTIYKILLFLAATAIVTYFFPHNDAFRYEFEVGKPWRYGLLTAPYDIPIYRSESTMDMLEDSVRRAVTPRFYIDTTVEARQLESLADFHRTSKILNDHEYAFLREQIVQYYNDGIVSIVDKDRIRNDGNASVWIQTEGNRGRSFSISEIPTVREAYESIMGKAINVGISESNLRRFDINNFLSSNLLLDSIATRNEFLSLMQSVSLTSGLVLAETRIIDRGEIVTPDTYDIINSYRKSQEKRRALGGDEILILLGQFLLVSLLLGGVMYFLYRFRPWLYSSLRDVEVAMLLIVSMVVLTSCATKLYVQGAYAIPIGIVTIVICTFQGARMGFFSHLIISLLCAYLAPAQFEFVVVQFIVGMVIIFSLKDGLTERSQLMRISILVFLTYSIVYSAMALASDGTWHNLHWFTYMLFLVNSLLLLLSYLIIFALEKVFGFMSGVTLVELCNLNTGLLAKLSEEASGTFQHSMQVSNLCAYAAKKIGANAQLVRTGALYHDVGKLWNPSYYTENQHNVNPHDSLTTEQSVEYIKRHVSEGVEMAKKAKLPNEIIEFIQTHHGRGVIRYFYTTWCNSHPNEKPDMTLFSYPGPDPVTREQALLMMGDSVEAASKSLKDKSEVALRRLVTDIIDGFVNSGRFRNTKLSFRDVEVVKLAFVEYLLGVYHTRISYPKLHKKQKN